MWISRHLTKNGGAPLPEAAKITLEGAGIEATGSSQIRDFVQYGPYGYQAVPPAGSDVLLVPVASGTAAVGAAMGTQGLDKGEIRITALSGAYLCLRGDGSVVINGLVISPGGEVIT